jgi:putative transposase
VIEVQGKLSALLEQLATDSVTEPQQGETRSSTSPVAELQALVGVRGACAVVGQAQARWYRRHRQSPPPSRPERAPATQPRALSPAERAELHRVLDAPEHVDEAPATVYAKLLDQGV